MIGMSRTLQGMSRDRMSRTLRGHVPLALYVCHTCSGSGYDFTIQSQ